MTFWNDLKRGAQVVVDEGQRMTRVTKLKARQRALELQLADLVRELGLRVVELHRRNELHHHELDELFVEIQTLERELKQRGEEVEELTRPSAGRADAARPSCPACGGDIRAADRFCRHCGEPLQGD